MRKRTSWMALAILISAGAVEVWAEEGTLPAEARALLEKSAGLTSYRAAFTMEAAEPDGKALRLNGTILYQRPDRRRVEIREGESQEASQLLVSDGKTEWQYAPKSGSVYRILNPKEAAGPHRPYSEVREGTIRFVEKSQRDGEPVLRFEAEPSDATLRTAPVPVRTVRLEIAEKDGLVRQMEILDEQGKAVLTQRFSGVEVNVPMEEGAFQFTLPEGVAVMDVPAEGQAAAP